MPDPEPKKRGWPKGQRKTEGHKTKIGDAMRGVAKEPSHAANIKAGILEWWRQRHQKLAGAPPEE